MSANPYRLALGLAAGICVGTGRYGWAALLLVLWLAHLLYDIARSAR